MAKKEKISRLEYMPPETELIRMRSLEPEAPPKKSAVKTVVKAPFQLLKLLKLPLKLLALPIKLVTWPFRRPGRTSNG